MRRPTREATRAAIESALVAAEGNAAAAADELGITRQTLYKRAERSGVDLAETRRTVQRVQTVGPPAVPLPSPPASSLRFRGEVITLSLADYAVLSTYAALGRDWDWAEMVRKLEVQDRIIAALTRQVEFFGSRQEAAA